MLGNKTSIIIDNQTRDTLKAAGRKGQTYADIIKELLEQKYENDSRSLAELRESKKVD